MFQFTPYALISFAATIVSIILALAIWRRRPGQGVVSIVVLMLGITVWTLANGVEMSVATLRAKILFSGITYFGIAIVPTVLLTFILEYTGRDRWLTPRNMILLGIEPTATLLFVSTNSYHGLIWPDVRLIVDANIVNAVYDHGILFWLHVSYSYILLIFSAVLLLRDFLRSPHLYRGQMTLMLVGMAAPWIGNGLYVTGLSPLPNYVDLTPIAFAVTGLATGWSLYRFRLMDLVPVAHHVVIENMVDALVVLDQGNRVVHANPAALKLLGRPANTVIGKPALNVLGEQAHIFEKFGDITQAQEEISITIDSEVRYFTMQLSPIYNRQGAITGRTVLVHDVTTLKRINRELAKAYQEAAEATQMKSQFLANMSHELRTPLNAIIGYSELQLTGMVGELSEIQYQYAERIFANAKHLLELINDILDLSKIEAGRLQIAEQPVALQDWFNSIVVQNRILAETKKLELCTEFDATLPETIMGDSLRLKQIVVNLLSNAIKFTSEGRISFILERVSTDTWKIIVRDTGIGIAPHLQETIFDEFHQIDSSSTRGYGGTGLGLTIVRKLVLLMKGTIRVDSELGKGTAFTVTLPIITARDNQLLEIKEESQ